jgi:hypothetical protein
MATQNVSFVLAITFCCAKAKEIFYLQIVDFIDLICLNFHY